MTNEGQWGFPTTVVLVNLVADHRQGLGLKFSSFLRVHFKAWLDFSRTQAIIRQKLSERFGQNKVHREMSSIIKEKLGENCTEAGAGLE